MPEEERPKEEAKAEEALEGKEEGAEAEVTESAEGAEAKAPTSHEVRRAHKEDLVRWCKELGLDHSGKVPELRRRLLNRLEKVTVEAEVAREAQVGEKARHEVYIYTLRGKKKGTTPLPRIFTTELRPDLIHRAVEAARANRRQPYGALEKAGLRHSVSWWGKGQGVARTPRIKGMRRGAQAPNTVGGRRAFPPKAERIWAEKINDKERRLARASALAATARPEMVARRGHRFKDEVSLPLVVEEGVEELKNTREAVAVLKAVGVYEDVVRASEAKVRPGRGKMRGRRFKVRKSLLVVLADGQHAARAFRNLPGVDVTTAAHLNTELLAPGGAPGRLTLFSYRAFKALEGW